MPRATRSESRPVERPDGVSEEAWEIAGKLKNVSTAVRLVAAYEGELPDDPSDTMELLSAAHDLEKKSLAAYLKFSRSYQPKLDALRQDYLKHRAGAGRLFSHVSGTPNGRDGAAS